MSILDLVFYFFGGLAILSSLLIVIHRNVLYNAFFLLISLLCVAGLYVFAGADFIAVSQIMIYVGGILVLLIFGVMFTNRQQSSADLSVGQRNLILGSVLGISLFALLAHAIWQSQQLGRLNEGEIPTATVAKLGVGLMTNYLIPFELAAILLLAALIGATLIAWKGSNKDTSAS